MVPAWRGVCVCVEHLNRCKTSTHSFDCRGMERTYEAPSNEAPHMILGYHWGRSVTYLHFLISQSMARGQAINRSIELFDFVYVCRNRTMNLFYWLELQSISEFKTALRMGYFGSGHYSTFHTFILGIPMITSKRTL